MNLRLAHKLIGEAEHEHGFYIVRGLSIEDEDTFFWMRAFPDQQSRERMRNEFYEGKLWKDELEGKLMPILEKFDVVIVEAKDGLGSWR